MLQKPLCVCSWWNQISESHQLTNGLVQLKVSNLSMLFRQRLGPITNLNKILIFQIKMLRIINRKPYDFSASPLYKKNKILDIYNLYKFKILIRAHSSFYATDFSQLTDYPNTRQKHFNLKVPFFCSTAGQRSLSYQESALWNPLPKEIKSIVNKTEYRSRLRRHLLG